MDEAEGVGGGDSVENFHRNEAISAVADEAFGEEDDDYEDLYNDVNVGEGFLQSLRKNENLGFKNDEESRAGPQNQNPPPPLMLETTGSSIPGIGRGEPERKFEGDGYQNQGFRGNDIGIKGPVQPNGGMGSGPGSVQTGMGRGYGGGGLRVELGQHSSKVSDVEDQAGNNIVPAQGMGQPQAQQPHEMNVGNVGNEGMVRQGIGVGSMNGTGGNMPGTGSASVQVTPMAAGVGGSGGGGGGGGTILFVGDLHWWTTDAELEAELVKYGPVKEVKFYDEKASGKSKGYCQVEFYDPAAASDCKEGMNGHVFNGRPCVVAFASPFSIKRMGESQGNRNQQMAPQGPQPLSQARRGQIGAGNKPTGNNITTGGNYQGVEQNRNFGRGNWGRGNPQGMGNRGLVGPMRNRPGGMAGRGIMGNGGGVFGQGMGPTPPIMPPQAMMAQGFDPTFGAPMGRMGNYGGFPGAPTPPFQGMLSTFPPVGNVGLPGVAPHVNPAFFGRGMPMNGMGMMPNVGVDGPNMGMWSDPNMGGWGGDEHGGRAGESSYGEEAMSDHQYGEASHDRGGWQNPPVKEKDKGSERDFSGSSDRRYKDDREPGYDRDMPREKDIGQDHDWSERRHRDDRDARDRERSRDRDRERSRDRDRERSRDRDRERDRDKDRFREDRERYADHHRYRDREADYDDEWERGRSSRTYSKSRPSQEEQQRSRSRDVDYGKRRRITSE